MFRRMILTSALILSVGLAAGQNLIGPFFPILDEELFFAHFGNGPGLVSEILLVSADKEAETEALVSLVDDEGNPMTIALNGEIVPGTLAVRIPASGTQRLRTSGSGPLVQGSVRVRSDRPLDGTVLFGGDFGLAGVGDSVPLDYGFLTPADANSESEVRTALAVANLENEAVDLELRLYDSDSTQIDSAHATLAGAGHIARFEGMLEVLSSGRIAATSLRVRPRQFASLPVTALLEDPRQPKPGTICEGRWSGTYDNGKKSLLSFRVADQSRIDSIRGNFTACNGQPALANASSGTIQADRSFSISLQGTELLGNFSGCFSRDGQSIEMQPLSGVLILLKCGGGSFSWQARPDQPCE